MKYQIFETSAKKVIDNDDIDYIYNLKRVTTDVWNFKDVHDSIEQAEIEIKNNFKAFRNKDLVILPIICVDYDSEISDHQRV